MPIFIDPRGHSNFGIGICGRCSRKFPLDKLYSDPNTPGLKVCLKDLDEYDPYRLPARQPDDIVLPFTRPDVPLDIPTDTDSIVFVLAGDEPNSAIVTEDGKLILIGGIQS